MAIYDNTKFYWLQLKEDFFDDEAIKWLEEQENGIKYAYFYLKLCLKALRTNGVLIRHVGKLLVPYDAKGLAELTRTDQDTVRVAMELLKKIGLIEVLEDGAIYIEQLEKLVGSQSRSAFKKQIQRAKQKSLENSQTNVGVDSCPLSGPPELELELELELKKDIYVQNENISDECEEKKNQCEIDFEVFWLRYPRKEGKKRTQDWFKSKKYKPKMFDEILLGLDNQLENPTSCLRKDKQYIPLATTWLNGERWKDELDEVKPSNSYEEIYRILDEEELERENKK